VNPFRYRGYYYDTETGLYYLQSRYYDPEIGRFINADGLVSTGQGVLGNNMFAYCENNWVNFSDPSGLCKKQGNLYVRCDVKGCMFAPLSTPKEMIITKPAVKPTPVQKVSKPPITVSINGNNPNAQVHVTIAPDHVNKSGKSDPNITINDSYKVKGKKNRSDILDIIIASPEFDPNVFTRGKDAWMNEWIGHNFLYFYHIRRGNTSPVDLNENEVIPWDLIFPESTIINFYRDYN